jgi:hypothetical protein
LVEFEVPESGVADSVAEGQIVSYPSLPFAQAAINPSLLVRLKEAGERAHATLEILPKEIAREYIKPMQQLQDMIDRLEKEGNK